MGTSFAGVFPALPTPLNERQELDLGALGKLVKHLISAGVHGVVPLGSTGEYYALTPDERERVLRTTLEVVGGRVPVVAGTNAGSTRDVVRFSEQAQVLGADGVLLAAPYYSLPSRRELLAHFRVVDRAIEIPIMLYNYPGRTGVDLTPDIIGELAQLRNVRYLKESTGDITRVSEILRRFGKKISIFCGCDSLAFESFLLGAAGWVGGIANVLPAEHVKLYRLAVREKRLKAARAHYFRLLPVLSLFENSGQYTQLVKAGCALKGFRVGPPRLPLTAATRQDVLRLKRALGA